MLPEVGKRQMKKVRAGCHKKAAGTVLPDS